MTRLFNEQFVSRSNFGKAYRDVIRNILVDGNLAGPRGMRTKELLGTQIIIPDARETLLVSNVRDLNYRFAITEGLWIIAGQNDLATLFKVNKQYAKFSDNGKTLAGAYGPRLMSQSRYIEKILKGDKSSRQAVATIWTPNPGSSKDIPCTISVQFLIRDDKLCSIWNMRSSDAWLGLPYDVFSFGLYTNFMASCLEVPTGPMALNLGSSHLYEEHWEKAYDFPASNTQVLVVPPFKEALGDLFKARNCSTKADALDHLIKNWRNSEPAK